MGTLIEDSGEKAGRKINLHFCAIESDCFLNWSCVCVCVCSYTLLFLKVIQVTLKDECVYTRSVHLKITQYHDWAWVKNFFSA